MVVLVVMFMKVVGGGEGGKKGGDSSGVYGGINGGDGVNGGGGSGSGSGVGEGDGVVVVALVVAAAVAAGNSHTSLFCKLFLTACLFRVRAGAAPYGSVTHCLMWQLISRACCCL